MNKVAFLQVNKGLFAMALFLGLAISVAEILFSFLENVDSEFSPFRLLVHWGVFVCISSVFMYRFSKRPSRDDFRIPDEEPSKDIFALEKKEECLYKAGVALNVFPVLAKLSNAHLEDSIRTTNDLIDYMNNKFTEEEQLASVRISAFVDENIRSKNIYENSKRMFAENHQLLKEAEEYKKNRIDEISGDSEVISRVIEMMDSLIPQVALIRDLSKKTNLLAFNAAIQAAKDDTVGKIFVVVAEEMRHLAEQSEKTTNEVKDIISQICESTKKRLGSMVSAQRVNAEVEYLESLLNSISSMTSHFEITVSDLEVLSNYAQKSSQKIFDTVTDVQHLAQLQDISRQQVELVQCILSDCSVGVDQVKSVLEGVLSTDAEILLDRILVDIERRYTMESQNRIHSEVVFGVVANSNRAPSVELF